MHRLDLRQLACDQMRVTAGRDYFDSLVRKSFGLDPVQDFANQPAVSIDRASHHCPGSRFAYRAARLLQCDFWKQRRTLIQKTGHRLQSWGNHTTDVAFTFRHDIERDGSPEIDDNGRAAVQHRDRRSICQPICSDCFWPWIFDAYAEIHLRT